MSKLRDDYDPTDTPLNSSAIFRVDTSLFELDVDETPEQTLRLVVPPVDKEPTPDATRISGRSPILKLQRLVNRLVYRVFVSRFYQSVIAGVLLLCLGLLIYSLTIRVDHIDDNLEIMAELGAVESELLALRNTWSGEAMQQLKDKVRRADQRRVFNDFQGLAVWLREKSRFADLLGLTFSYQLGEAESAEIDDMLQVPISLSLKGRPDTKELYLRALEFLKLVVSTAWYVEIIDARLEGNGVSSQGVDATLRVWVHGSIAAGSIGVQ